MSSFVENILNTELFTELWHTIKRSFRSTKVGRTMEQLGIDEDDLGQVAKGVINVIGVADKSVDNEEEVEEEVLDDEEADAEEEECEEEEYEEEEEAEEEAEDESEDAEPSTKMKVARGAIDILKSILKK